MLRLGTRTSIVIISYNLPQYMQKHFRELPHHPFIYRNSSINESARHLIIVIDFLREFVPNEKRIAKFYTKIITEMQNCNATKLEVI